MNAAESRQEGSNAIVELIVSLKDRRYALDLTGRLSIEITSHMKVRDLRQNMRVMLHSGYPMLCGNGPAWVGSHWHLAKRVNTYVCAARGQHLKSSRASPPSLSTDCAAESIHVHAECSTRRGLSGQLDCRRKGMNPPRSLPKDLLRDRSLCHGKMG